MLMTNASGFPPACRPKHLLGQFQPPRPVHAPINLNLFRNGIIIARAPSIQNRITQLISRACLDFGIVGNVISGGHTTTLLTWHQTVNSRFLTNCKVWVVLVALRQAAPRAAAHTACNKPALNPSGPDRAGFVAARRTLPNSAQQTLHLRQRFIQLARVLAATAGVVGLAAAFAADDRSNLLNDFTGLHFRGEVR